MIYTVKTSKIETKPGWGNHTLVEIFGDEKKLGEYKRNYASYSEETFCPFTQGGQEYALYSKDYSSTRIMKLPECIDLGGENSACLGFCPTQLWVPQQIEIGRGTVGTTDEEYVIYDYEGFNGQWGFVAGCIWGDDSSWKMQLLDLRNASKGEIKRVHEFGYHELPEPPEGVQPLQNALKGEYTSFDEENQNFYISSAAKIVHYQFSTSEFDLVKND